MLSPLWQVKWQNRSREAQLKRKRICFT